MIRAAAPILSYIAVSVALALAADARAQPPAGPAAVPPTARAVPAETTAGAVKDPRWRAPRTSWGHPSFEGVWSTDGMRVVPARQPETCGTRATLTGGEFLERATRDEGGKDAAANRETFLRNEWGIRSFGYSSLVVDPPNGRVPEMTAAGKARAANRDRGTFGVAGLPGHPLARVRHRHPADGRPGQAHLDRGVHHDHEVEVVG